MDIKPNDQKPPQKNLLTALGAGFVAILLKFKLSLLFFLKYLSLIKIGWIFSSFGSMLISFGFYTTLYGWPFALTLIALLYIHEMGHFLWMKALNLNPNGPVFIPGLGAYVAMKNLPTTKKDSAWVAMAGPLVGGLASVIAYTIGLKTNNDWLIKSGATGFILNLFQLIPAKPFDGGFIVAALSKWLLVPGAFFLLALSFAFHSGFLILISVVSFIQVFMLFGNKPKIDDLMQETNLVDKALITIAYVSLISMLAYLTYASRY